MYALAVRGRAAAAGLALVLFGATPALAAPPSSSDNAAGDALASRMLGALGGRANWARLTSLVNDSRQFRTETPTQVRAVISMDFTRPRFRIETVAADRHVIRVIDGDRDWRRTRDGTIEAVPADVRADDLRWYAGHVYRTIHRIARRDPTLRLAVGDGGRLDVYEGDGRIAWYRLDVRGEPYAFGGPADEVGSVSGPWTFERAGIRHPSWVARPDGSWRAQLVALEVNAPLEDALFARPEQVIGFEQLQGRWAGVGEFGGRPARLQLDWSPALDAAFTRLRISITDPAGVGGARFEGEGLYRRTADGIVASWFDSTGNAYPVSARIERDCLVAVWGAGSTGSTGRSSYCRSGDTLTVTDEIASAATGQWSTFGRYELRREP
jgi:hypothetical protein